MQQTLSVDFCMDMYSVQFECGFRSGLLQYHIVFSLFQAVRRITLRASSVFKRRSPASPNAWNMLR